MPALLPIVNNNGGQPITTNGSYCQIQVPGNLPPAISPGGCSQAQFGTLTYSITAGSSGGGTVVTFMEQMGDGISRALVTPAPITVASGQIYTGTVPFPVGGMSLAVSALTGNGLAGAQLVGYQFPLYLTSAPSVFISPVTPPPVTPPPPSNPPPNVPAAASAQGFNTLVFSDEFNTPPDIGFGTSGHKWSSATWYDPTPTASTYVTANSILTITADATNWRELNTQWQNVQGGTFFTAPFYAEASMMCTDWSAFWFYPAGAPYTPVINGTPSTYQGEIDVIETDQSTTGFQTKMTSTVHVNTGGAQSGWGGISYYTIPASGTPFGQWHTYGILLNNSTNLASFYCDNVLMGTIATGASNYRPMTLLFQASPGNVNQGKSGATAVVPPTTKVDWVRVWQASAPVPNWTTVQACFSQTYSGGVGQIALDQNTTSGNLLVVFSFSNALVSSIAISAGVASFARLASLGPIAGLNNNYIDIWYAKGITGGTKPTISVTLGSNYQELLCYEFTGVGTATPDGSNTATGTGTAPSVSMTTVASGDLVLQAFALSSNTWTGQGAGWVSWNGTPNGNAIGYNVQAAAGAITAAATQNSATAWGGIIAALKK